MQKILKLLTKVVDTRQEKKVQHKMSDIIAIVLFASLGNANEWMRGTRAFSKKILGSAWRYTLA